MFLIVSNGVQIVGSFTEPKDAETAYNALVAEHPESVFAVFDQVHPVEDEADADPSEPPAPPAADQASTSTATEDKGAESTDMPNQT